jgi:hypothetical protein
MDPITERTEATAAMVAEVLPNLLANLRIGIEHAHAKAADMGVSVSEWRAATLDQREALLRCWRRQYCWRNAPRRLADLGVSRDEWQNMPIFRRDALARLWWHRSGGDPIGDAGHLALVTALAAAGEPACADGGRNL